MSDSCSTSMWKVEFNMSILIPLESFQNVFRWCAKYVMDFVDLVEFILTWEKWEQGQNLEENTTHSPDVHFVIVIPFCQQTLG